MREIRTLRVMWRGLDTGSRGIPELPRQFSTLPPIVGKVVRETDWYVSEGRTGFPNRSTERCG